MIPKIATGFGAGIGGQGLVCGAISGAVMALGIKFGRDHAGKKDIRPYWYAKIFLEQFRREWKYVTCRELTGCDLCTDMGRKRYDDDKMWETKCRKLIGFSSEIAYDLIQESC